MDEPNDDITPDEIRDFLSEESALSTAHLAFGNKPALLAPGDSAIAGLFGRLEEDGKTNSNFFSVDIARDEEDGPGHEDKLIFNRANFAALMRSNPQMAAAMFPGHNDPNQMLNTLKAQEPIDPQDRHMGFLLGYGVQNSENFHRQMEGMPVPAGTALPWQQLPAPGQPPNPEYALVSPPGYANWDSPESRQLAHTYRAANAHITQQALAKHGYTHVPFDAMAIQGMRNDIARGSMEAMFSPPQITIPGRHSNAQQPQRRAGHVAPPVTVTPLGYPRVNGHDLDHDQQAQLARTYGRPGERIAGVVAEPLEGFRFQVGDVRNIVPGEGGRGGTAILGLESPHGTQLMTLPADRISGISLHERISPQHFNRAFPDGNLTATPASPNRVMHLCNDVQRNAIQARARGMAGPSGHGRR